MFVNVNSQPPAHGVGPVSAWWQNAYLKVEVGSQCLLHTEQGPRGRM